jgi:hypothetical protein
LPRAASRLPLFDQAAEFSGSISITLSKYVRASDRLFKAESARPFPIRALILVSLEVNSEIDSKIDSKVDSEVDL